MAEGRPKGESADAKSKPAPATKKKFASSNLNALLGAPAERPTNVGPAVRSHAHVKPIAKPKGLVALGKAPSSGSNVKKGGAWASLEAKAQEKREKEQKEREKELEELKIKEKEQRERELEEIMLREEQEQMEREEREREQRERDEKDRERKERLLQEFMVPLTDGVPKAGDLSRQVSEGDDEYNESEAEDTFDVAQALREPPQGPPPPPGESVPPRPPDMPVPPPPPQQGSPAPAGAERQFSGSHRSYLSMDYTPQDGAEHREAPHETTQAAPPSPSWHAPEVGSPGGGDVRTPGGSGPRGRANSWADASELPDEDGRLPEFAPDIDERSSSVDASVARAAQETSPTTASTREGPCPRNDVLSFARASVPPPPEPPPSKPPARPGQAWREQGPPTKPAPSPKPVGSDFARPVGHQQLDPEPHRVKATPNTRPNARPLAPPPQGPPPRAAPPVDDTEERVPAKRPPDGPRPNRWATGNPLVKEPDRPFNANFQNGHPAPRSRQDGVANEVAEAVAGERAFWESSAALSPSFAPGPGAVRAMKEDFVNSGWKDKKLWTPSESKDDDRKRPGPGFGAGASAAGPRSRLRGEAPLQADVPSGAAPVSVGKPAVSKSESAKAPASRGELRERELGAKGQDGGESREAREAPAPLEVLDPESDDGESVGSEIIDPAECAILDLTVPRTALVINVSHVLKRLSGCCSLNQLTKSIKDFKEKTGVSLEAFLRANPTTFKLEGRIVYLLDRDGSKWQAPPAPKAPETQRAKGGAGKGATDAQRGKGSAGKGSGGKGKGKGSVQASGADSGYGWEREGPTKGNQSGKSERTGKGKGEVAAKRRKGAPEAKKGDSGANGWSAYDGWADAEWWDDKGTEWARGYDDGWSGWDARAGGGNGGKNEGWW